MGRRINAEKWARKQLLKRPRKRPAEIVRAEGETIREDSDEGVALTRRALEAGNPWKRGDVVWRPATYGVFAARRLVVRKVRGQVVWLRDELYGVNLSLGFYGGVSEVARVHDGGQGVLARGQLTGSGGRIIMEAQERKPNS